METGGEMRAILEFPRRTLLPVAFLFLALGPNANGQEALLPTQLGPWQQIHWEQAAVPELEGLAGQSGPLLREYGAQRAEQAVYRQGAAQHQVTIYEMLDRSGAYGAYTLLRAGGKEISLGEAGARLGDRLVFYQGNYFATIDQGPDPSAWQPLANRLKKLAGSQPSLPNLPFYLPREGLVAGSDRYLLGPRALQRVAPFAPGDWAGFAYGAEVEAARYQTEAGPAILLLISYPTPQIAAERLRDFARLFNLNGSGEPLQRLVYARRKGTLVAFVEGLKSAQAADRLASRVKYGIEISWSEPSEARTDSNWAKTLLNLFVGTGLFVLFALGSGLLFAAIRLIVKRLAPGKVFDRPSNMEIIQLDLENRLHPIDKK